MSLKIISLYREVPKALKRIERRKKVDPKRSMYIDLHKKLKPSDLYYSDEMKEEFISYVFEYMNPKILDSHNTVEQLKQIENFKIEDKIKELYEKCKSFLPKNVTIYILFNNPEHDYLQKIKGVTVKSPHRRNILLFVWPMHGWHQRVELEILKQFAIITRMEKLGENKINKNLLETMITEGIANNFAHETMGQKFKLRVKSETKLWDMLKPNLRVTNKKKMHNFMTGSKKVPYLGGVFMGHRIVKNYLDKTKKNAADIITEQAKIIFKESDYSQDKKN